MWNKDKSLALSYIITIVVFAATVAALGFIPSILKWYFDESGREQNIAVWLYIAFYGADLFAMTAIGCLWAVLGNIRKGEIFVAANVKLIRLISWCSFGVAIAFAPATRFYLTAIIVFAAAAFFGLTLRVLKNVIEKAVEIREENDATI